MSFRVTGLDPAPFQHLHALSDEALAAQGIERVRITEKPAAPCRISLDDAEIGEAVLLLSYEHQPANTPYRQQGPIFIRETSARASTHDVMPPALARRMLSLRAFDAHGAMVDADVCEGAAAQIASRVSLPMMRLLTSTRTTLAAAASLRGLIAPS